MKQKIFIYFIILTVLATTLTGYLISKFAQSYYQHESEQKLLSYARMIEYKFPNTSQNEPSIDLNSLAKNYSQIINSQISSNDLSKLRVTFISKTGIVLGESDSNYLEMENHIDRKEIQDALSGKSGTTIHYSNTLKTQFLYTAILAKPSEVIIRVSMPLLQLNTINRTIWSYSLIAIFISVILNIFLSLKLSSSVAKPISQQIRSINKELEKTVAELVDKNVKVDTIINSMISGIVAVDINANIMLINSKACEMFGITIEDKVLGKNIIESIRNHHIYNMLTESINKNTAFTGEIHISFPMDKMLRVHTVPIKTVEGSSANSGGILFLDDITNIKKLEQIRTEFVSNVTHELKTPLTSIRGFIETLRGGAIEDKEVSYKFLDIIDIEAERLYLLINDILSLSEIESKQRDSNIGTHKFKDIVEEIVPILQSVADKKKISLSWDISDDLIVVANKDRIKQMLINLTENAIKYNIENGSVEIRVSKVEGKTEISVKDSGIGIAPEHVSRIFERFYRVDRGRSRSMGGTGLGLSIVKHIVNLYNGEIKIYSELGKGTNFIIKLPT